MGLRPYIGITDFESVEQVEQMLRVLQRERQEGSQRMLHVGVMMSYKTLNNLETKWASVFPPKQALAGIFSCVSEDVYNCLHYADYDGMTSRSDLFEAIGWAGCNIDGVQLDMPWPDPEMVSNVVRATGQGLEIILQVGERAIDEAGNDPAEVAIMLEEYDGIIDRVLLDKSMGRGLGMNAEEIALYARKIRAAFPKLGLVAAGGLGPETLHLVNPLIREFPDISIDAQGKLRPSGNATHPIDWDYAERYLTRALKLFKQ